MTKIGFIRFAGCRSTKKTMVMADYVSKMKKIKHPYNRKIGSREGIEYLIGQ